MPYPIKHIFVLMLENRSFDHMLGAAELRGIDAETGGPTVANGLGGPHNYSNSWGPLTFGSEVGITPQQMPADPGHGFSNTLDQLCYDPVRNHDPRYPDPVTGGYPPLTNGGFVKDWVSSWPSPTAHDPSLIMMAFLPKDLPVLSALAGEFAVCDNWFSSLPGPTWPNRWFVHTASSAGLDDGISPLETAEEFGHGVSFEHGSIYDLLDSSGIAWAIYAGDLTPQVESIAGIYFTDISDYADFASDLRDSSYAAAYTFIEPNYGMDYSSPATYLCGNSQHPDSDVARGELLIKSVYEAIRNSPHWENSLLIITYDEHGGFYDHVPPPAATPPGDAITDPSFNQHNFKFDQLGVRVPAVVVSPLIPKGTIDHRVYDHSSVPRTIEEVFGLPPLTNRDVAASSLTLLLSLSTPRTDAPTTLSANRLPDIPGCGISSVLGGLFGIPLGERFAPLDPSMYGFLLVALRHDLAMGDPNQREELIRRMLLVETKWQAAAYLTDVSWRYPRFRGSISREDWNQMRAEGSARRSDRHRNGQVR